MLNESFGRVYNEQGEIVAEGNCSLDMESGRGTLHPFLDTPLLSRTQGPLRLSLDDGTEWALRKGVIQFRLNAPGSPPGPAYRMFLGERLVRDELPPSGTGG